jgi:tetratricopeptide repeat protein 21B
MSAALLAPDFLGVQSLILYYARKKLYHHVSVVATQALQKRANDPAMLFWRAYATFKEGHMSDALRELDGLRTRNGVQLPTLICLKQAHNAAKFPDREALQQIDADIKREEGGKTEGSFFIAAQVCMLLGEHKRAREYLQRTFDIQANYPQAKSLAGWIELTCGSEVKAKKAIDLFKEAQAANPADVDAALGHAMYMELAKKDLREAVEVLTGHKFPKSTLIDLIQYI